MRVQSQTITRKQTDQSKCQLNQQRLRVTVNVYAQSLKIAT